MKSKTEIRGAITVEAAIALPVFICVVISLAMLIKLIYIQDVIQHAIDEAANELAAYSYIYHISDIQEIDDSIQDAINGNSTQAKAHEEIIINAYKTIDNTIQTGEAAIEEVVEASNNEESFADKAKAVLGQVPEIYEDGQQLTNENIQNIKALQQLLEDAGRDPRKELESLAWMLSRGIYDDAKTVIAVSVIRQRVKKYLMQDGYKNVDDRLKKLNVYGGLNGLDFYSSCFFKDNQDIDIVVKYRVELPLPIKLLPDIYIAQRSTARAWLEGGDGAGMTLSAMDIWALPNKERGMKIEQMYGGNLPFDFPVIDIYDEAAKKGTSIKSINLNSKTYKDGAALKKKLISYVDSLREVSAIKYKDNTYSLSTKKFILIVPKDSINENNRLLIEQIRSYAEGNGIEIEINEL